MKLLVSLDGRPGTLTFDRKGETCTFTFARADGQTVERTGTIREVEPGIYSVLVDGHSHEVKVVSGPLGLYADLDGHRSVVEVRDPRSVSRRGAAGAGDGRQNVSAPMPGKVIRVLVHEGEQVEKGTGLLVVEAMKMQNEMKAPRSGRVLFVKAKEGDTVAAGEVLVAIE